MDYQQITCKYANKNIKADKIYKVRNDDCLENIVSICFNCPHCHSDNSACKNCYGTIIQSTERKINKETRRVKMSFKNYRNTFIELENDFMEMMSADEYLKKIEIISNLNNCNWNHGQRISDHLRAYDGSKTSKTDCKNCKIRCHKNNQLTACEKAKEYLKKLNINLDTASELDILNVELDQDMICREQTQRMFYV